jgi:hypothetical protein
VPMQFGRCTTTSRSWRWIAAATVLLTGVLLGPEAKAAREETFVTVGVGLGAPTGVSARLWAMRCGGDSEPSYGGAFGPALEIQVGSGGGKLAVGYGVGGFVIATIRAAVVRTWRHPWMADPNRTYAGPELEVGSLVGHFTVNAGVLFGASGSGSRRTVASLQLVIHSHPLGRR